MAWLMTSLLIDQSGNDRQLKPDDRIDDVVVDVAQDLLRFDAIVHWFKDRLIRVP